jgi:hypothetical protein
MRQRAYVWVAQQGTHARDVCQPSLGWPHWTQPASPSVPGTYRRWNQTERPDPGWEESLTRVCSPNYIREGGTSLSESSGPRRHGATPLRSVGSCVGGAAPPEAKYRGADRRGQPPRRSSRPLRSPELTRQVRLIWRAEVRPPACSQERTGRLSYRCAAGNDHSQQRSRGVLRTSRGFRVRFWVECRRIRLA